jgi:hypothetical protein
MPTTVDVGALEQARRDPRVRDFLAAAGGYGARTMRALAPGSSGKAPLPDPAAGRAMSIETEELQLARRDPRVRHLLTKAQDYGRGLERRDGLAGDPRGAPAVGTGSTSEGQGQPQAQ